MDAIATLLADECARTILYETLNEPMSAEALSEQCDVSPQTVYRRLDDLKEHNLIAEQTRLSPAGHHYKVYAATLNQVVVDLTTDGFEIRVTRRERMADKFTQFIEDMR
ncbi:HTH domain-containing protein [Halogeometricum borinquense]|uniref:HTH domain-containing protein n=1 Tax=Halogeometricum borinquense TaxID=60847 RepID=A0A482T7X6_9EURY|nr:HTH domain-containing protein [Halogeometricum borinquense]